MGNVELHFLRVNDFVTCLSQGQRRRPPSRYQSAAAGFHRIVSEVIRTVVHDPHPHCNRNKQMRNLGELVIVAKFLQQIVINVSGVLGKLATCKCVRKEQVQISLKRPDVERECNCLAKSTTWTHLAILPLAKRSRHGSIINRGTVVSG